MKTLRYTFDTEIHFSEPVVEHTFVLRCQPHRRPGIRVLEERLDVEPEMRYMRQVDAFGNHLAAGRAAEPHTRMRYLSCGLVEVDPDRPQAAGAVAAGTAGQATPGSWTAAHPIYCYPSALTTPDDALLCFAGECADMLGCGRSHATREDGSEQAPEEKIWGKERLSHTVHERMEYVPGSTHVRTTAAQAFAARAGVCQDFSHVLICVLRELGVPARYVSGLALGEGQTHAWVEAFVDGSWKGFDPTRDQLVDDTYIPLAVGRDWTDCPIEQGSFIGAAQQTQTVYMTVTEAKS